MLSIDYRRGYNQGLKVGLKKSVAIGVMNKDLIYAYGCMALVLTDRGWGQDDIEDLIDDIQAKWVWIEKDEDKETMAELVKRLTGVELEQRVVEIVERDL